MTTAQKNRLDFFAAAALTGLMANGHTHALAPMNAAAIARAMVAELDKGQTPTKPKAGDLKGWAAFLTQALAGYGLAEVRRDDSRNIDIYLGRDLLMSVCKSIVWVRVPVEYPGNGRSVANAVLAALEMDKEISTDSKGGWYFVANDGQRIPIGGEHTPINR